MRSKIVWTKLPSVTRQGKWFYRAIIDGVEVTVLQSMYSGRWSAQYNGRVTDEYETSRQAKTTAEDRI